MILSRIKLKLARLDIKAAYQHPDFIMAFIIIGFVLVCFKLRKLRVIVSSMFCLRQITK